MKQNPPIYRMSRLAAPLLSICLSLAACGGDEKTGPGGEGGASPEEQSVSCETKGDCDDQFYCNGVEICVEGTCRQGTPIACDDGVSCTVDRCDEAKEGCVFNAPDKDGDGSTDADCLDESGAALGDDCDDDDPLSFPGNAEVCDGENRDEDCDPSTLGVRDSDNDGYIDALCCNTQADDSLQCGDDCDDYKPNVNPAATEACDFLDNNCDGETDEGVSVQMLPDADHDGHGDSSAKKVKTCAGAVGFALKANDCNDNDPEIFVGQFEICDGKDNNCINGVDEVEEQAPWFIDADGDTYGDPGVPPVFSCKPLSGRVLSSNDCNDQNEKVNPNATEICDALDNDCNGLADFKLSGVNNFEDDDKDGAADQECGGDDCNDLDARTSAGAEEVCDHIDNDCDGIVDEQTVQNIWYTDEDGDGWGVVQGSALASCDPLVGRASKFGDCDDTENGVHPGTTEYCDGVDEDCDGEIDEGAHVYCRLENAVSSCIAGGCEIFSCVAGFADVNRDPQDGCEAVVDPSSLDTGTPCTSDGECNDRNICNGIESCQGGTCRLGTSINCAIGAAVLQGDVEIDNGLALKALLGVETITGSLTISGSTLTSLLGLESLKSIGGSLIIYDNNQLARLSGSALSNLQTVGGDIIIQKNDTLVNVDLPSLVSANSIRILNNQELAVLSGFERLEGVQHLLQISGNFNLNKIEAFPALQTVGGFYSCDPTGTDACTSCREGESIVDPTGGPSQAFGADTGGIIVSGSNGLVEILGFGALLEVEGDFCIENAAVETNTGASLDLYLPALSKVGMILSLQGNQLQRAAFPQLETVGALEMKENSGKIVEVAFPGLLATTNDFPRLDFNVTIDSLESFDLPLFVDGDVRVILSTNGQSTPATTFTDFVLPQLRSGSFLINASADGLKSISLPSLTTAVDVPGELSVDAISVNITSPTMESLNFPLLQSAATVNITVISPPFQALDLGSLSTVTQSAVIGITADDIQSIDLSALTTVSRNLYLNTPMLSAYNLNLGSPVTVGGFRICAGPEDTTAPTPFWVSTMCTEIQRVYSDNNNIPQNEYRESCGACGTAP